MGNNDHPLEFGSLILRLNLIINVKVKLQATFEILDVLSSAVVFSVRYFSRRLATKSSIIADTAYLTEVQ